MGKYVYLFELDSVRKTDREIEIGQKALYDEIVGNGNIVVLTYNQLVDSRGFFSLLHIPEYYSNLIELFENGSIRISQYGDIRTIAQYLISSFDYDKEFIYSGWPLKSTQRRLLALIRRSLMYSDLSEIHRYINTTGRQMDKDILDLFIEVGNDKNAVPTRLSVEKCRDILENLYWLLKTVLRLSSTHTIYIPPRNVDEYQDLRLHNILDHVIQFDGPGNNGTWNRAVALIRNLPCYGGDNRSCYLHDLLEDYQNNGARDKIPYQYAEAIINLAYNYACEISICNISKHYNIHELMSGHGGNLSFMSDFHARLKQYWELGDLDRRFLLDESNRFDAYNSFSRLPDFTKAVRMTGYAQRKMPSPQSNVHRYEYKISEQRNKRRLSIMASIGKKICLSLVCILIACGLEFLFQFAQTLFDDVVNLNTLVWSILETLLFLFVTEGVTTLISGRFPWLLSLSDALGGIGRLAKDAVHIITQKTETYSNRFRHDLDIAESYSEGTAIDFVKSDAIKKYLAMRTSRDAAIFSASDIYPIADTGTRTSENIPVLKELAKIEEMYNCHFGVVYQSRFNTMIVDPIVSDKENAIPFFPYERVIPTAGNGVVMVPRYEGRLILLRQYRHASRRVQLAFPRGYGEPGLSPDENAKKELGEEIGAVITRPIQFIGTISPDSGLANTCAHVYLVDLDAYTPAIGHEGILDVISYSDHDFEKMLCHNGREDCNNFDDGFTLAAYTLYRKYKEKKEDL